MQANRKSALCAFTNRQVRKIYTEKLSLQTGLRKDTVYGTVRNRNDFTYAFQQASNRKVFFYGKVVII